MSNKKKHNTKYDEDKSLKIFLKIGACIGILGIIVVWLLCLYLVAYLPIIYKDSIGSIVNAILTAFALTGMSSAAVYYVIDVLNDWV